MGTKSASEAKSKALAELAAARQTREAAEANEQQTLRAARAAGASWARIGELYGLTKQGAQQRFKRCAKPAPPDAPSEA